MIMKMMTSNLSRMIERKTQIQLGSGLVMVVLLILFCTSTLMAFVPINHNCYQQRTSNLINPSRSTSTAADDNDNVNERMAVDRKAQTISFRSIDCLMRLDRDGDNFAHEKNEEGEGKATRTSPYVSNKPSVTDDKALSKILSSVTTTEFPSSSSVVQHQMVWQSDPDWYQEYVLGVLGEDYCFHKWPSFNQTITEVAPAPSPSESDSTSIASTTSMESTNMTTSTVDNQIRQNTTVDQDNRHTVSIVSEDIIESSADIPDTVGEKLTSAASPDNKKIATATAPIWVEDNNLDDSSPTNETSVNETIGIVADREHSNDDAKRETATEPCYPSVNKSSTTTNQELGVVGSDDDSRVVVYRNIVGNDLTYTRLCDFRALGYSADEITRIRPDSLSIIATDQVKNLKMGVPSQWLLPKDADGGDQEAPFIVSTAEKANELIAADQAKQAELRKQRRQRESTSSQVKSRDPRGDWDQIPARSFETNDDTQVIQSGQRSSRQLDPLQNQEGRVHGSRERARSGPRNDGIDLENMNGRRKRVYDSRNPYSNKEPLVVADNDRRDRRRNVNGASDGRRRSDIERDRKNDPVPPKINVPILSSFFPDFGWLDVDTVRRLMRSEAKFRMLVMPEEMAGTIRSEHEWRLNLYREWLRAINNGIGESIVPPSRYEREQQRHSHQSRPENDDRGNDRRKRQIPPPSADIIDKQRKEEVEEMVPGARFSLPSSIPPPSRRRLQQTRQAPEPMQRQPRVSSRRRRTDRP